MENKVKFHTIIQPESDTTTFVLSCNRLGELKRTLESFQKTRDYVTKMIILDDSAEEGVFESLVEDYGHFCDVICFPRNRCQWWALDFMVSYCDTEYIFYLEDDWEFIRDGYLNKSKKILQDHREIGVIDISWRTFEGEGHKCYEPELIENSFYWKKTWRITDYHVAWYGWIGSPNLKRRDDLILLGRIEKWHNEWNIDRKFKALGFKSVFLDGQYCVHLGDHCSKMAAKRHTEGRSEYTTPESYYPAELEKNRLWPKNDYSFLDTNLTHPYDITIVSAMVDIGRERNFEEHYFKSLENLLASRHPIFLWCEEKYFDRIREIRGDAPIELMKFGKEDIEQQSIFEPINKITQQESWYSQSEWMKNSVIRNPYYIPLTMLKHKFLKHTKELSGSRSYYWVDSGMFSSYGINESINDFYLTKIPKDRFFMPSYSYNSYSEIHGFDINGMTKMCGSTPDYVCRATLFGGSKYQIDVINELFDYELMRALELGYIGTEEAIYTILSKKYPDFFNRVAMPNGSIYNYLSTIKAP